MENVATQNPLVFYTIHVIREDRLPKLISHPNQEMDDGDINNIWHEIMKQQKEQKVLTGADRSPPPLFME